MCMVCLRYAMVGMQRHNLYVLEDCAQCHMGRTDDEQVVAQLGTLVVGFQLKQLTR